MRSDCFDKIRGFCQGNGNRKFYTGGGKHGIYPVGSEPDDKIAGGGA